MESVVLQPPSAACTVDDLTAMFGNLLRSGLITREDLITQGHSDVATSLMAPPTTDVGRACRRPRTPSDDDDNRCRGSSPLPCLRIQNETRGDCNIVMKPQDLCRGKERKTTVQSQITNSAVAFSEADVLRSASIAKILEGSTPQGLSSDREEDLFDAFEE
jgi:hypothetical protein